MLYPLNISIDPNGWRLFSLRRADPAFRKFQEKVFARDEYSCSYCSFQGDKYFEVINIDGNYNNNKLNNMTSACCICAQCKFLQSAGHNDIGGGRLIYESELSQNQINSLSQVLFCAITNNTGYKIPATNIMRNFKFASRPIEEKFGEGSSDPTSFSKLIIESDTDLTVANEKIMKNMRLLPSRKGFAEPIEYWSEKAVSQIESDIEPIS